MTVSPDTAVILERLSTIDETLNKLNVILVGNGTPEKGVAYRLGQLEISVIGCQLRHGENTKTKGKYLLVAFSAVFGATIALISYWLRNQNTP